MEHTKAATAPPPAAVAARSTDVDAFRGLMAGFPSGVAVVTTTGAGTGVPFGLTCTSLCAVSLAPPMLLVSLDNRSGTLRELLAGGGFAVNLLHRWGRRAAEVFATGGGDRFAGVVWRPAGDSGLPCLTEDAHSFAECRVRSTTPAGDHTVVIAEVVSVRHLAQHPPLLYGLRGYAAWPSGGEAGSAAVTGVAG
ncbi:flavin reductase family protein [Streptomyces sp. NPDC021020]|uniref:flavin reductase family protein n=1 Tax=Streptomyces sp. NPDC021020 TaxID=3365109 RepID=UPI00378943E1